eukprot:gene1794-46014_t
MGDEEKKEEAPPDRIGECRIGIEKKEEPAAAEEKKDDAPAAEEKKDEPAAEEKKEE